MVSEIRDERVRSVSRLSRLLSRPELGAAAGTVLVFVFFAITAGSTGLFSAKGIVNFLEVSAQLGILAAPVALLMIAGEFDLSVGSMIGFAGILIAIPAVFWGWPIWLSLLFTFAVCGGIGALNGLAVVRTGLPSFIVTLGSLFMLRGLTLGLTRGISGRTQVSGVHELAQNDPLNSLFSGQVFPGLIARLADIGLIGKRADGLPSISGIPVSIVWWIVLTLACTWLLTRSRFGNWIFAAGGEANAARNLGVPVARTKITLFVMTALAAALFAAIQVLVTGSADTLRGTQKEFEAIIAVVIGGTLLTGGYGSAIGAMFGALIFGVVQMGIFYTGIDTDWFKLFMGAMMVIAVLFNSYVRNRAMRSR
ncbi:ABC transporter permease [Mesorhizobium sp. 113-3-3]|uniref:ABC transporter permease n=1 Tax=Mesorhizobium sp. 113-3-3 TaxID=2744516 RepID=UPI00192671C9|nr:ABC transporter permease [Mesorhizobium sp. 113-3-3]BCG78933.1 sugar ABC transporter permease [Mesorhizobium sp. 113-3-3]